MMEIHVSYCKKVPGQQQYSSDSFMASLRVEVADEIAQDSRKLQKRLNALWQESRKTVEAQLLQEKQQHNPDNKKARDKSSSSEDENGNANGRKASNKQIQYLINLAKQKGKNYNTLAGYTQERLGKDVYALLVNEASSLIDELKR